MQSNLPFDLTLDIEFKTLWYHGNKYVRKCLMNACLCYAREA